MGQLGQGPESPDDAEEGESSVPDDEGVPKPELRLGAHEVLASEHGGHVDDREPYRGYSVAVEELLGRDGVEIRLEGENNFIRRDYILAGVIRQGVH